MIIILTLIKTKLLALNIRENHLHYSTIVSIE